MNAKRSINMDGQTTTVYDGDAEEEEGEKKEFNFDFSLWSHFDMGNDALAGIKEDERYDRVNVDQNVCYTLIGAKLLDYMWEGYDVCMFAYGQSGSGKSFSMTGTGPKCGAKWKGMIPRISNDNFVRSKAAEESDPNISFKITASMLEIYLDDIYDLLIPKEMYDIKTRKALQMQMDNVDGLSNLPVATEDDVTDLLVRGFGNQTKAPTGLNVDSSRGHTIFTLDVNKKVINPNAKKKAEREQVIHTAMKLVDLAGSERTEKVLEITKDQLAKLLTEKYGKSITVSDEMMAQYKAERTTEGRAINNSLTTLGNCVKAVAKISGIADAKEREKQMNQISWRSSSLTRLLRTALNGKCKTIMIAAVSPSVTEYPETISTMRYASQIKQIKSTAVKKEAKLTAEQLAMIKIAELEAKLAEALKSGGSGGGKAGGEDAEALKAQMAEMKKKEEEIARKEAEMEAQMRALKDEQKKRDAIRESGVHLVEIVNNPMTSGLVPTALPDGKSVVAGMPGEGVTMVLRGIGVRAKHCVFTTKGDQCTLTPSDEKAQCMVNGKIVTKAQTCVHNDRIRLAENNYFRFLNPKALKALSPEAIAADDEKYTYDFLREEALRELVSGFQQAESAEEQKRRLEFETMMAQKEKEFAAKEAALAAKQAADEQRMKGTLAELQKQLEQLKAEDAALLARATEAEKEFVLKESKAREEAMQAKIEAEAVKVEKDLLQKKMAENSKLQQERHAEEKKLMKLTEKARQTEAEKARIQYDLMDAIPACRQANACAREIGLLAKFDVKLISVQTPVGLKNEVCVALSDDSSASELWKIDKFREKFSILSQQYYEWDSARKMGKVYNLPADSPYFVSHHALQVIGHAKVMLNYIYFNMEIQDTFSLVSYTGQISGEVAVTIAPKWTPARQKEADGVDNISQLSNLTSIDLKVDVHKCGKLPTHHASDVRVELNFPDFVTTVLLPEDGKELPSKGKEEDEEEYNDRVGIKRGGSYITPFKPEMEGVLDVNPVIGYSRTIRVLNLNPKIIKWFEQSELVLTVSGEVPDQLESAVKSKDLVPGQPATRPTTTPSSGGATGADGAELTELRNKLMNAEFLIRRQQDEIAQLKQQKSSACSVQ